MTIFARDVDSGKAKWAYQMTPWDAWDYDGVNEMILADLSIGGKAGKAIVHFHRKGVGDTLDRTHGSPPVAEKFDPDGNWATSVGKRTGRPSEGAAVRAQAGENSQ